MWREPLLPNGSALTFSWLVPQFEPWKAFVADAPPARPRCAKVLWRKRGTNASVCCNLATGAKILGELCHAGLNLALAFGDTAGKAHSLDCRKSVVFGLLREAPWQNQRERSRPAPALRPRRLRALPFRIPRSRTDLIGPSPQTPAGAKRGGGSAFRYSWPCSCSALIGSCRPGTCATRCRRATGFSQPRHYSA